jgi:hypothetical protein
MITNALDAGTRLTQSSTFWASLLLPTLKVLSGHFLGIEIPWEIVMAGIGAQGVRNAAAHVADGMRDAAQNAADAQGGVGAMLGSVLKGALGLAPSTKTPSTTATPEVVP